MAKQTLEFFFDISSPWTYLAFEHVLKTPVFENAAIEWKPILVGGVFNTINPSVYENRANPVPPKQRYYAKDLKDWAGYVGIEIGSPPVFPVNSVKIMRGAFVALEAGCLIEYARCGFESYWRDLNDISEDVHLRDIVERCNLNWDDYQERIRSQHCKDLLRATTDELVSRGGFGSPTFFLQGEDMYFGNDRVQLLQHKLGQ